MRREFDLLLELILSNSEFEDDHEEDLREIFLGLSTREEVNETLHRQTEIEASVCYFLHYYRELKESAAELRDEMKNSILRELPAVRDGYKLTGPDKNAMVHADESFVQMNMQVRALESLLKTLADLHSIVFGRTRKIEQLSNNQRAEIRSDTGRY